MLETRTICSTTKPPGGDSDQVQVETGSSSARLSHEKSLSFSAKGSLRRGCDAAQEMFKDLLKSAHIVPPLAQSNRRMGEGDNVNQCLDDRMNLKSRFMQRLGPVYCF